MSYLNGKLNTSEETLNFIHSEANVTDANLDALTNEANKLEVKVKELRRQVHNIKNANIHGENSNCSSETGCSFKHNTMLHTSSKLNI